MARRALSWAIDFVLNAGLVSLFYFCAVVFYLDAATEAQGHLMLVCAVVALLLLTVYLPATTGGQSLGERICRIAVVPRDGRPRTALSCFVRECVLKIALGPFLAVFCALDYGILGCIVHRDPDHELIVDFFCKTRVVPIERARMNPGRGAPCPSIRSSNRSRAS